MKFKEIVIPTLTVASLISNIADVAASFEGITHVLHSDEIVFKKKEEIIALPCCVPQETNEESDQIQANVFQCVYNQYYYKMIICFIISYDEKHAMIIAKRFKQLLDKSNQFEDSSDWTMSLNEEPKSPAEILEVAMSAEVVYTLTTGEKIEA